MSSEHKQAKDLPPDVERYVQEGKDSGMDEGKAWAVAWSRWCLTGETLVATDRGIRTLAEIASETKMAKDANGGVHVGELRTNVSSLGKSSLATHIMNMGESSILKITTSHGYELRGTLDHRVLTLDASTLDLVWKPIEKLSDGDLVVIQCGDGVWGDSTRIRKFKPKLNAWNNVVPLRTPTHITPELARILGYLVSEGSITEDAVGFCNTNPDIVADYARCVRSSFSIDPKIEWCDYSEKGWKRKGLIRLRTTWFRQFFQHLGMSPGTAQTKTIPECILKSPKSIIVEFLKAYAEGDGYLGDAGHKNHVVYGTVSSQLARQFQVLLTNFGIPNTLTKDHTQQGEPFWKVVVNGYKDVAKYTDEIGSIFKPLPTTTGMKHHGTKFYMLPVDSLRHAGKQAKCVKLISSLYHPTRVGVSLDYLQRKWSALEKMRIGNPKLIENVEKIIRMKVVFDRVSTVVPDGMATVYDISVPETEAFSANGVVVHNCKYKKPGDSHCQKNPSEYFNGRESSSTRVAFRFLSGDGK